MSRLNDVTPEEWDRVNAPQHVYYGGERVDYPVRAYTYGETDPVTEEDLDELFAKQSELFADGYFINEKGEDTYEEYIALTNKIDDLREERMNIIGQNGNDGLHYDSPKDKQVGSDHYKSRAIQPIDYIIQNGLSYCEGNVVKYVTRHKEKNGKEDIQKAIHYLEFILESEYGEGEH